MEERGGEFKTFNPYTKAAERQIAGCYISNPKVSPDIAPPPYQTARPLRQSTAETPQKPRLDSGGPAGARGTGRVLLRLPGGGR
jgi:hypothetical protein